MAWPTTRWAPELPKAQKRRNVVLYERGSGPTKMLVFEGVGNAEARRAFMKKTYSYRLLVVDGVIAPDFVGNTHGSMSLLFYE